MSPKANSLFQKARTAALAVSIAAPVNVGLADENVALEPITVTLSRVRPADPGDPQVTVLDRAAIEDINAPDLGTLLRQVAGVQTASPAGRAGPDDVFIRGGEPNFTVVLIDGVQVNDPSNTRGGSFDFGRVDLGQVERIEVVRGALSSIHGSDAMSGLISITTRAGEPDSSATSLAAEVGADGWRQLSFDSGIQLGAGSLRISAGHSDDGDVYRGSAYDGEHLGIAYMGSLLGRGTLQTGLRVNRSDAVSFPEDSGGPRLAVGADKDRVSHESRSGYLTLATNLSSQWLLTSATRAHRVEDDFLSPGVAPGVRDGVPPNGADSRFTRLGQVFTLTYQASDTLRLAGGYEYEHERGVSEGFVDFGFRIPADFALTRRTSSFFLESLIEPSASTRLTLGVRHDDPTQEDSATSFSAAGYYRVNELAELTLAYAEGYKLPSFFALASPLVGNPALRPESSRTTELGAQITPSESIVWTARVFDNRYQDLIDFDPDQFTNVNRSRVRIRGGEVEVSWLPSDRWDLGVAISHVDIDVDGGGKLRRRPRWFGYARALYKPNSSWGFGMTASTQGSAFDSSIPTGPLQLDGWTRVDATARWRGRNGLNVWLSVDNLLDENYESAIGFPAAGIQPRLRIERRW